MPTGAWAGQYEFFEPAGSHVPAAPKEKNMKRTISLWLGLLAFALLPALAQTPTGKIHGHVTNPVGTSTTAGAVSLSTDDGHSNKYTFPVDANGDYKGEANPGTYMVIFRTPDMPVDKMADSFEKVKIVAGADVVQDIDMSRKEFIDKLPAESKKQLEEMKRRNAEAMKANEVVKSINADARTCSQDLKDADAAYATAKSTLPADAKKADIDAKVVEIKTAKYTEIETLMKKDIGLRPAEPGLWAQLAQAQVGLKEYDDAETSYKKALELDTVSKKPNPVNEGASNAGLGEIYARTGKVPEAKAAYEAAAKANPPMAGLYLTNEAKIFYQEHNSDAQAAAADEAIHVDPTAAINYYLKGGGLIVNATADPKTSKLTAPAGCLEAYQKYLELDPNGIYAAEVKDILTGFNQKIDTT